MSLQCSYQTYSTYEELVKLTQQLSPVRDEATHSLLENDDVQPLVFEKTAYVQTNYAVVSPQNLKTDVQSLEDG